MANTIKKITCPTQIHRIREPIRDLVDFSENIHRTREPIRDLENSSFQDLKNSKKAVPKKCRGIVPIPFLYYLPLKFLNLFLQ